MTLRITARKTKKKKYGYEEEPYDVSNIYYKLSDGRIVTRKMAAELVKSNELRGYHIYERDDVEYIRDNPGKEESDNINSQPLIPWPCDLLFPEDISAYVIIHEDGSGAIGSREFGEFRISHDYLNRYMDEGGSAELGLPVSEQQAALNDPSIRFQGFEKAIMFTNDAGAIEVFAGTTLQDYIRASCYSLTRPRHAGPDDVLAAQQGLGLPRAAMQPTPHGHIRVMGSGAMYFPERGVSAFYANDRCPMVDGRMVLKTDQGSCEEMIAALASDPYLPNFRKNTAARALRFAVGQPCGDTARDLIGTISREYCSEFVREVYCRAGMDYLRLNGDPKKGHGIYLWSVTYANQLMWIFQHEAEFVGRDSINQLTAEPGDCLYMDNGGHSALAIATSLDGQHLWKVGGNEDADDCIVFGLRTYFDMTDPAHPVLNERISGIGRIRSSMF
ncbi:MAG: DUF3892 domain-containing protein [Methanocellales archaeon]|nr:DUF3892 domain-containing protein [Methanocellales archaeon]MDD3291031.1 DUF3892 domain-containing protein [Methanocellales archaeon]MDD5234916.1 DUF3892 domain-containing protein [Methanocellales archaeon]MDD5484714.1 DUF3892 domain-containing protein [Methanocellales archaeon]